MNAHRWYLLILGGGCIAILVAVMLLGKNEPSAVLARGGAPDVSGEELRHEMVLWLATEGRRSVRLKQLPSARYYHTAANFFGEDESLERLERAIARDEQIRERVWAYVREVVFPDGEP